ncbi:MAG: FMN-binding protein [Clostridia bacterium]|nr:FMN-binding protein [Clostridia bacterium]NCC42451.1 FMN-binding protein [Clostridia bacterium]
MHEFWVRLLCVVMIGGVLMGYNSVVEAREKEEEIAKLSVQLEEIEANMENGSAGSEENQTAGGGGETAYTDGSYSGEAEYADGIYSGEAEGFGGLITVETKIEQGKISEVTIISADGEDGAYLSMAEEIIPDIIEGQSAEVDTISGATFSSTGIKNAVIQALEKAVK